MYLFEVLKTKVRIFVLKQKFVFCKGQIPKLLESFFPVNASLKLHILDRERKKECHSLKGETWKIQRKRKMREGEKKKKKEENRPKLNSFIY